VPDLSRPELLGLWGEAQIGIDLPPGEEIHLRSRGMGDPVNVLAGIQAHMPYYRCGKHVLARAQFLDGDTLPLSVANRVNAVSPKQLKASDVDASQEDDGESCIDLDDLWN
jgi:hypothetical protein